MGTLKIKKRVNIKNQKFKALKKKEGLRESFYLVGAVPYSLSMGSPQPASLRAGHESDPDS